MRCHVSFLANRHESIQNFALGNPTCGTHPTINFPPISGRGSSVCERLHEKKPHAKAQSSQRSPRRESSKDRRPSVLAHPPPTSLLLSSLLRSRPLPSRTSSFAPLRETTEPRPTTRSREEASRKGAKAQRSPRQESGKDLHPSVLVHPPPTSLLLSSLLRSRPLPSRASSFATLRETIFPFGFGASEQKLRQVIHDS